MKNNDQSTTRVPWHEAPLCRNNFAPLRFSMAIIFIWFGILKPLGESPAEDLVASTVYWFSADWFIPVLGWWEVAIGIFFLARRTVRLALILLLVQLPGTFLPLIITPEIAFNHFPFALTLEGQYIIKNVTLIAIAITVASALQTRQISNVLKQSS